MMPLWIGGTGLALVVAVAAASLVTLWRAKHPKTSAAGVVRPGERAVSWAIVVGIVYAVCVGIGTVLQAVGMGISGGPILLTTEPYWPSLPDDIVVGGLSDVTSGGYTSALVTVPEASAGVRIWQIIGLLFSSSIHVGIALVVVAICRTLRQGKGILGSARQFTRLAVIVLIGGLGAQLATGIGAVLAAGEVLPFGINQTIPGLNWPEAQRALQIELWPVFPALALAALAGAFRYSERLQRDTEGLV